MKKNLLLIVILFITIGAFAQPWLDKLPQNKSLKSVSFFEYQKAFNDYWKPYNVKNGYYIEKGIKKKAEGWKQFKRWEYKMEAQIDPATGMFPKKSAQQVYDEFVKANPQAKGTRSANWTVVGPSTTPGGYAGIGRLNCIAFHPSDNNTYWVGAATGGLWKTTNGGSSWTCLTDNNDVLAVSDIVIPSDYATSNTIYIATGDKDHWDNRSVGVLKTTNGGATWNTTGLSYSLADGKMLTRLLIDPNNNNILIAATNDGVYKTTNGGITWSNQLTSVDFIDMEYKSSDFNTLYGSTTDGYIYVSTNGGSSWTQSSDFGERIELAVTPANSSIVYAIVANSSNGLKGIYKSSNSGSSFSMVYDGSVSNHNLLNSSSDGSGTDGQGWYDLSLAVSPSNANIVVVGGVNTWRSTNGGASFSIISHWWGDGVQAVHADKHRLQYRSNGDLFECNDGGLYFSSNNGTNFTNKSNGLIISEMYKLGVSQTTSGEVITGLQDNGTKLFSGGNWSDVKGGDGMECLIDYSNNNIQYATYTNGQISRTTNHWGSSTDIEPAGYPGAWVTPYIIDPSNHNTLYAGYADVWKTTNQGNSWTKISTMNSADNLRSMAISSDGSTLYVADYTHLWKTTNGGTSWSDVTGTIPVATSYIRYIAVKDGDPNTLWVTTSSYNTPGVYESTNGGASWTNISTGLPQIPVWCVVQNKQSTSEVHLYAGTELGVYLKKGTDNWVRYSDNLPNAKIGELEIYYDANPANSKLYAATFARGLWVTPVEPIVNTLATVTTTVPSSITQTSVTSGGNVTAEGGSSVTERGIVWGNSLNPTTSNNKIADAGTGTGSYTLNITGLSASTTYHVRAYAINSDGTSYGADNEFTTTCGAVSLPFSESFDGATMPTCWSTQTEGGAADKWTIATSSNSGGSANEAHVTWENVDPAKTRLITPPINTVGVASLDLTFKHYFDEYATGCSVKVQSSTDGVTWTDESWSIATTGDVVIGPETINTTITNNTNSPNTYIAFVIDGNLYQFDDWYIDDVNIEANCGAVLPFSESFDGSTMPTCWTTQTEGGAVDKWAIETSNNSGGSANEAHVTWENIDPATTRLITPPINTIGVTSLDLTFKHYFDEYATGCSVKVQSSTDGTTWTDESWSIATTGDLVVGPETINTTITNNLNSANTYIAFVIDGNLYQFDDWYIDDVNIKNNAFTDLEITQVYTIGKLPIAYGTPHNISAIIKNNGSADMTNIPVSLNITGDNTFSDVQNIASLVAGASATVIFSGYNPVTEGTQQVEVTIPNDDDLTNNSLTKNIITTLNSYSYAQGNVPDEGVGFNGNTGDFVAKFTTNTAGAINQVDVEFTEAGNSFQIGIWDATGVGGMPGSLLFTSSTQTSSVGNYTLLINPAISINTGDFYVGVRQLGTTNVMFGFQYEEPIRDNTFFWASPSGDATWNDFAPGNPFRFMIEPKFAVQDDVSTLTASANNGVINSPIDINVEIINYGTNSQSNIPVYYTVDAGAEIGPLNIPNTIAINASATGVFNNALAYTATTEGTHTIKVYTKLTGDQVSENDAYTFTINTIPSVAVSATPDCSTGTVRVTSELSGTQTFYLRNNSGGAISDWTGNATYHDFTGLANGTYKGQVEKSGFISDLSSAVTLTNLSNPTAATSVSATETTICNGSSTSLSYTGGSGDDFKWYTASCGGTSVGTGNSVSVNPTATTTYYGRWENTCGNSTCKEIIINVDAPTTANAGTDANTCDANYQLSGNNPSVGTGTWSVTNGAATISNANSYNTNISITSSPVTLQWEVVNGTCSANDEVIITLNPTVIAPTSVSATETSICSGSSTILSYNGGSGDDFKWYTTSCGGTLAGTGNSVSVSPTVTTTYYGRWENSCGNSSCEEVTITIAPDVSITTQPNSETKCEGEDVTFTVIANNATGYQWKKGVVNISGATNDTYTISGISLSDAGDYSCEVIGTCENAISNTATLTVNDATIITDESDNQEACTGSNVHFYVTATGTGTLTYQWKKNGSDISGATSSTYDLTSIDNTDAGTYTCYVTGDCGNTTSSPMVLSITTSLTLGDPSDENVCLTETATFTVVANGTNTTFQWKKDGTDMTDGGDISGATTATLTIANCDASDEGNYTCDVTSDCGNASSEIATLSLNDVTSITDESENQEACVGSNVNFFVSATGSGTLTYQWQKDGSDISGANSSTLNLTGVDNTDAGTYTCIVTSDCGNTTSSSIILTISSSLTLGNPANVNICLTETAVFTVIANATNTTFQWKKGGVDISNTGNISGATTETLNIANCDISDEGDYTCMVTSDCGNATSEIATLAINDATSITTQPVNISDANIGEAVSFSVVAEGTNLTYQWKHDNTEIVGATNDTYNIASVTADDAGNYIVTVTGDCGNAASDIVTLTVATSIKELAEFGISIYPNPSNGVFTIELNDFSDTNIEISDVSGKIIYRNSALSNKNSIDLSRTAKGIYFIKINKSNKIHVAKIIFN